jgi:hypothetical protein
MQENRHKLSALGGSPLRDFYVCYRWPTIARCQWTLTIALKNSLFPNSAKFSLIFAIGSVGNEIRSFEFHLTGKLKCEVGPGTATLQ